MGFWSHFIDTSQIRARKMYFDFSSSSFFFHLLMQVWIGYMCYLKTWVGWRNQKQQARFPKYPDQLGDVFSQFAILHKLFLLFKSNE